MKRIFIFLSLGFLIISSKSFAQTDTTNIYYQALKLHLDHWDNLYSERPIPDTYFVETDDYSTAGLPNTITRHSIQYLTFDEIREKTKKGKSFPLIAIRPVKWDSKKNSLIIAVIDYSVSRTRRTINYGNVGGSSFEVVCGEKGLVTLKAIRQGGI